MTQLHIHPAWLTREWAFFPNGFMLGSAHNEHCQNKSQGESRKLSVWLDPRLSPSPTGSCQAALFTPGPNNHSPPHFCSLDLGSCTVPKPRGPLLQSCKACTWTYLLGSYKIQRNYMGLKITPCACAVGASSGPKDTKFTNSNGHF